jgi:hypothetical protein
MFRRHQWPAIARASLFHGSRKHQAKHFFYAAGWKKFEPLWDLAIRTRQLRRMTPLLEAVLAKVTRQTLGDRDAPTPAVRMPAGERIKPTLRRLL